MLCLHSREVPAIDGGGGGGGGGGRALRRGRRDERRVPDDFEGLVQWLDAGCRVITSAEFQLQRAESAYVVGPVRRTAQADYFFTPSIGRVLRGWIRLQRPENIGGILIARGTDSEDGVIPVGFRRLFEIGADFGGVLGDEMGDCESAVVVAAGHKIEVFLLLGHLVGAEFVEVCRS